MTRFAAGDSPPGATGDRPGLARAQSGAQVTQFLHHVGGIGHGARDFLAQQAAEATPQPVDVALERGQR